MKKSADAKTWMDAIGSPDREVRIFARDNFANYVPESEIGPLALKAAGSDDYETALTGLKMLSKADIPGRGKVAILSLNSERAELVRAALEVIKQDPVPESHDTLEVLLANPDVTIQSGTIEALAAMGNPDDTALFIDFLSSSSAGLRKTAHDAIIKIAAKNPEAVNELLKAARGFNLSTARQSIEILGEIGGNEATAALFEFVTGGPPGLASDAATALGKIGGEDVSKRALGIFREGDSSARSHIARVLEALHNKNAMSDLWQTVINPDEDLWARYYSMEALTTCGDETLVPEIITYFENGRHDDRITGMAIEALGGMGGPEALDLYDSVILGEKDFGLDRAGGKVALSAVIRGLGHMDTDESRERLRKIMDETDPEEIQILIDVIRSFSQVGTEDDIERLRKLGDQSMVLESPTIEAIAEIEKRKG
ncbi:MAG: hypothetical protein ABIC40_01360 [bacterium]